MRWLFLLVLALNIIYILMQINSSPVVSGNADLGSGDVNSIVLLRELEDIGMSAEHDSADYPSDNGSTVLTEESAQDSSADNDEAPNSSQLQPENDASAGADVQQQTEVLVDKQSEKPDEAGVCFTYGPFRELEVLLELKREITPYVAEIEYRSREENERSAYWVHIKPLKNRNAANAMAKKLKAKKIKDFYIVRSGENNNAISLGHFKSKKRANDLSKALKKQGVDVDIEPIFKSYTLYWLDYQLASGAVIPGSVDKKYAKQSSQENFSRLDRECD